MSIKSISVAIMAKNASSTIVEVLNALKVFDEVILYLNDSTDDTEKLAQDYSNVVIEKGSFLGFGKTKNKVASYASNDWILSLDSDEILNPQLIDEIISHQLEDKTQLFVLKRDNYFLGHKTQDTDEIVRIYNRQFTHFNDNSVHEKIEVPHDAKMIRLQTSFTHLNITNVNQTLTKMIQYTDLGAEGKKTCFFTVVIAKSLFAFFKIYILKGNFLKGWVGIALGMNAAHRRYYKYLKQFVHCQESKKTR